MGSLSDKIQSEYLSRVRKFADRLHRDVILETVSMTAEYHRTEKHIPLKESITLQRVPIKEGEVWASAWESGYFRLEGKIPDHWPDKNTAIQIALGGEVLLYSRAGHPLCGLTSHSVFDTRYVKELWRLPPSYPRDRKIEVFVEAAANDLFGISLPADPAPSDPDRHGVFKPEVKKINLVLLDETILALYYDVLLLHDLAQNLPEKSVRRARLIHGLNKAVNRFADNRKNADAARALLRPLLTAKNGDSTLGAVAVGHAHIDTAWLWRLRESVRKTVRTFASQLELLDRYPGYVFGASQPQLYAFVKERHPELYARIKEAVQQGRWETQGGMWVEADCNIISGESMVRQFLHGKNFFKTEFGVEVRNCWIPDVFGYSGNLPQIMKRSGIDFFLTQKMSWNQFNPFPHHTFRWRGVDGSEVLTHFPPEATYNSQLTAGGMKKAEKEFSEKGFLEEYMVLFGMGDGGGGPREENIESGLRQKDLEGLPKLSFGRADDFFRRLEPHAAELAVHSGELYLELHRGTLTTQARIKRYNRAFESLLRQIEALYTLLPLDHYPLADLDRIWKMVLTHQFHDIIPGSSIHAVYEDAHAAYEEGLTHCRTLIKEACALAPKQDDRALTLFNAAPVPFDGVVLLPKGWRGAIQDDGRPVQVETEDADCRMEARIPAHGSLTLRPSDNGKAVAESRDLILENSRVRYRFSDRGTLVEGFDKEINRSFIPDGAAANLLTLYDDRPNLWDAWDIDFFYPEGALETAGPAATPDGRKGTVRHSLRFRLTIGESTIDQTVSLSLNSKRLDFTTKVEWRERHRMLRVAFPTNVQSQDAAFDIQYGFVRRPTHTNTGHDFARFETAGHRYADLSEGNFGVALLNDCKYGYKVRDGVLDLNLLRSPAHPDADADSGTHEFTYALLPHTGDLVHSDVWKEAENLNLQPLVLEGVAGLPAFPFKMEGEGVAIMAIKRAETEECRILRLVETRGMRAGVTLTLAGEIEETNLIEWTGDQWMDARKGIALDFTPFAIRTFKYRCD